MHEAGSSPSPTTQQSIAKAALARRSCLPAPLPSPTPTPRRLIDRPHLVHIGHHVIPNALAQEMKVYAFQHEGYWHDVSTLRDFFETNLDLANPQGLMGAVRRPEPVVLWALAVMLALPACFPSWCCAWAGCLCLPALARWPALACSQPHPCLPAPCPCPLPPRLACRSTA